LVEAAFLSLAMILIGVSRQGSEGNRLARSSMAFLTGKSLLRPFVQSYYSLWLTLSSFAAKPAQYL
jgi:hypothetical protein